MKRGYTALEYKSTVRKLRAVRPGIAISSDFIVGFPGETDADFERTMALVDDVGFDYSFSFLFSPRPGTPAAALADDTPPRSRRRGCSACRRAIEAQGDAISRIARRHGAARSWSKAARARTASELMGRTECNRVVNFAAAGALRRRAGRREDHRSARPFAARRARRLQARRGPLSATHALSARAPRNPAHQSADGAGDDHRRVGRHPAVVAEDDEAGDRRQRGTRRSPSAHRRPDAARASSRRQISRRRTPPRRRRRNERRREEVGEMPEGVGGLQGARIL